jgi:uncharacterized protein (TIGR02452 family)
MSLKRSQAAAFGREAVAIIEAGHYRTAAGAVVDIAAAIQAARAGTCSYPPDRALANTSLGRHQTRYEVTNETTRSAAARLVDAGQRAVALNFASAKHPGGGFLGGARAQEESLARSSALYACLAGHAMYDFHARRGNPMYTAYAIYSPDVPVFRDDAGTLLPQPFLCSFITAPAVNARAVRARDRSSSLRIREEMRKRIGRVLAIAAEHGHEALVLGAWGCGVFGNDTREVAGLFHEALTQHFRGAFAHIIFAVLDSSADDCFIGPFRELFASPA